MIQLLLNFKILQSINLLILLLILSFSYSLSTKENKDTVLLTVISTSTISSRINEYGLYKSRILQTLSIDNRLRYCKKYKIYCIIGGTGKNGKLIIDKLMKSFKQNSNDYDINLIKSYNTYSGRFLKILWISRLLSFGISRIAYLDEDAFIIKPFSLDSIFDSFSTSQSLGITNDFGINEHRYNTGVIFIKKSSYTDDLFCDLLEKHQTQHQTEFLSDQILFNYHVTATNSSSHDIKNFSRILYNSLPTMDDSKPYWNLLGLKNGDEDHEKSHIVHFAGIYGGANQESGIEDPVITLLIMKSVVLRHLNNIQTSNEKSSQYFIDSKRSITILESMLHLLNTCIPIVFRSVDSIFAETYALKCLDNTTTISKDLLSQYTNKEFANEEFLVYNPNLEIY